MAGAALVVLVGVAAGASWLGARAQVQLSAQGGALSGAFVPTSQVDLDPSVLYGVPDGVMTMVAVDASPGEAVAVSYWRNDGQVTVTLVAPDVDDAFDPFPLDLVAGDPSAPAPLDDALTAPGTDRLTVGPGETVGVRVTLGDPCMRAGFPLGPTVAVLEATALGITRQVALPLDPVPLVMSTVDPTC